MTVLLREVRGGGGRSRQAGGREGGLQKHLIAPAPPPLCHWVADRLPAHDPLLPLHGPLREDEIPSERRRQRRAARGQIPTALGAAPGPTDPAGSGRICPLRTDHLGGIQADHGDAHRGRLPCADVVTARTMAHRCRRGPSTPSARAGADRPGLLGLELTDPGFDHSVLCEFRARLLAGSAEERLLHKLLDACQARGLLEARGRQRTDSTRVLASIRALNRLELVGETLRAALNELATVAPDWLREVAPKNWYGRHAHRVEDGRLPRAEAEREAYARTVGEDGFALLALLERPEAPEELRRLPTVGVLRRVWERQFVREDGADGGGA